MNYSPSKTANLARHFLGYVAHPLFFFLGILYLHLVKNHWGLHHRTAQELNYDFASVVLNLYFFPMLLFFLAKGLGFISGFALKTNKQRIIPFLGTMIFTFWAWRVAKETQGMHPIVMKFMFGLFLSCVLMTLLSGWISFSIYTCGLAMGVHFLISSSILGTPHDFTHLMLASAFIAVGLWYSMRYHTVHELIFGALIGLISQSLPIFIF